jgi:hypothetical protein
MLFHMMLVLQAEEDFDVYRAILCLSNHTFRTFKLFCS